MTNPQSPFTVLIVDDDIVNLQIVEDYLDDVNNLNIISQQDSQKVSQQVLHEKIDLILSDIEMPVVNGYQLAGQLKSLPDEYSKIPMVALTGHSDLSELEHMQEVGFDDYLPKPIDPDQLVRLVESYLPCAPECKLEFIKRGKGVSTQAAADEQNSPLHDLEKKWPGFNFTGALSRLRGNQELLTKLIKSFGRSESISVTVLESHMQTRDLDEVERFCHRIKGTAANIGAEKLSSLAGDIEDCIKAGNAEISSVQLQELTAAISNLKQVAAELDQAEVVKTELSDSNLDEGSLLSLCHKLANIVEEDLGEADRLLEELAELTQGTVHQQVAKKANDLFNMFQLQELKSYLLNVTFSK